MSTNEKYSCKAAFLFELGMYIGVILTTCSLILCRRLLSVLDAALLALMSYLLAMETQSNLEGRAQLILIWMVLVEVNRIGYNPIKSWEPEKTLEQVLRLVVVGSQLVSTSTPIQGIRVSLYVLGTYFFVYEIMKAIASYKGQNSYLMGKNPTLIHNYAKSKMLKDNLQTTPMDSCDYVVLGEKNCEMEDFSYGYSLGKKKSNSKGILTIGEVRRLNLHKEDTFISLALSKMLMRRSAKIPADEAGGRKALNFVLQGLIGEIGGYQDTQTDRNNKMERVFRIIEEELTIVDDFLNVRVPTYYYYRWYTKFVLFGLLLVLADGIYLIDTITKKSYAWLSRRGLEAYNQCFLHLFANGSDAVKAFSCLDLSITIVLVVACIYSLIRESKAIFSLFVVKSHSWSHLKSLEKDLENPANLNRSYSSEAPYENELPKTQRENTHRAILRFYSVKRYLKNPANWYRSYSSEATSEKEFSQAHGKNAKKDRKYSSVLDPSFLPKSIKRKFLKPFLRAFVSADAKEAILTFLVKSGGQLTNGETSLKRYGMEHLNWACHTNDSNTEAILVWHIATTLLQQNNDPNQESALQQDNKPFTKEVALSLSSYCHYLVLCLPELLPDDVKWTEKRYANVMKDIMSIRRSSDRCKYALMFIWNESSVVGKGAKLAKELMNCAKEGAHVWTMLAHFWAEMMLFIAPSDNVEGHAKYLHLNQKELITQLWALLTHAGIINRPKPTEHQGYESESNADTEETYRGTMEFQGDESKSNADTEEAFHGIMVYPNPSAI